MAGNGHHILASGQEFIMAAVEAGPDKRLLTPMSNKLLHAYDPALVPDRKACATVLALHEQLPDHPGAEDMMHLWRSWRGLPPAGAHMQAVFVRAGAEGVDLHAHPAPSIGLPLRIAEPPQ